MEPRTANSSCLSRFLLHSFVADLLSIDNFAKASAVKRSMDIKRDCWDSWKSVRRGHCDFKSVDQILQ